MEERRLTFDESNLKTKALKKPLVKNTAAAINTRVSFFIIILYHVMQIRKFHMI